MVVSNYNIYSCFHYLIDNIFSANAIIHRNKKLGTIINKALISVHVRPISICKPIWDIIINIGTDR